MPRHYPGKNDFVVPDHTKMRLVSLFVFSLLTIFSPSVCAATWDKDYSLQRSEEKERWSHSLTPKQREIVREWLNSRMENPSTKQTLEGDFPRFRISNDPFSFLYSTLGRVQESIRPVEKDPLESYPTSWTTENKFCHPPLQVSASRIRSTLETKSTADLDVCPMDRNSLLNSSFGFPSRSSVMRTLTTEIVPNGGTCASRESPEVCTTCRFCTRNHTLSCCNAITDKSAELAYGFSIVEWLNSQVSDFSQCLQFYREFWCLFCYPYSSPRFDNSSRLIVCKDTFCRNFYCACKSVKFQNQLTLGDHFTELEWCELFARPFFTEKSKSEYPTCFAPSCPKAVPPDDLFTLAADREDPPQTSPTFLSSSALSSHVWSKSYLIFASLFVCFCILVL